jgi:hypothetical protein
MAVQLSAHRRNFYVVRPCSFRQFAFAVTAGLYDGHRRAVVAAR